MEINTRWLKWFALLMMTLDHIGFQFYEFLSPSLYLTFRALGRLAFPIFAWFIAYGALKTRNRWHYFLRLTAFAFFSEVVIQWACRQTHLQRDPNTFFTLALGLLALTALDVARESYRDVLVRLQPISESGGTAAEPSPWQLRVNLGYQISPWIGLLGGLLFFCLSFFLAEHYQTDYGLYGVSFIVLCHLGLKKRPGERGVYTLAYLALFHGLYFAISSIGHQLRWLPYDHFNMDPMEGLCLLSILLIYSAQPLKKRPDPWEKYFFYLYYPLHIVLLILLRARL